MRLKQNTMVLSIILLVGLSMTAFAGKHSERKGYLGVSVDKLTVSEKRETGLSYGVIVTDVQENKAADKAGIKTDDIILFFNGKKMRKPVTLIDAVRDVKPGTEVKVTLFREGKNKEISVTVGKLRSRHSWSHSGDGEHFLFSGSGSMYLGVRLQALNADLASYFNVKEEGGVLILSVDEESPAENAGLKAGDVIVSIDDVQIEVVEDVTDLIGEFDEETEIKVDVIRHGKKKGLKATLAEQSGHRSIQIHKGFDDFDIMIPELEILRHHDEKINFEIEKNLGEKLKRIPEQINRKIRRHIEKVDESICI